MPELQKPITTEEIVPLLTPIVPRGQVLVWPKTTRAPFPEIRLVNHVRRDTRLVTIPRVDASRTEAESRAASSEPMEWLDRALTELDTIAENLDLGTTTERDIAVRTTRHLLEAFATKVKVEPIIGVFVNEGITIEFEGHLRSRLTMLIRANGAVNYYERSDGRRWRGKFNSDSDMLSVIWPGRFRRAEIPLRA